MTQNGSHPEQEPAEGSRKIVERELARQDEKTKESDSPKLRLTSGHREEKDEDDGAGHRPA